MTTWERAWERFTPFLDFPPMLRRVISPPRQPKPPAITKAGNHHNQLSQPLLTLGIDIGVTRSKITAVLMPLDETFLEDVGLGSMPSHEKKAFLEHIYSELELRVGTALSDELSDEQIVEFNALFDGSEIDVRAWVGGNAADYEEDEMFQNLVTQAPPAASELDILREYATLKWIQNNRSNYQEIVVQEIAQLRDEISENAARILAPYKWGPGH